MQRMPGAGGSSSLPRRASATEGVRVTKVGVANFSREKSLLGSARSGESRDGLLTKGSSAGLASQEAVRTHRRWRGARAVNRRVGNDQARGHAKLRVSCRVSKHPREGMDHLESFVRGQPRRAEPGLGRSRSCSWIVPIAGEGDRRSSSFRESGRSGARRRSQALWSDNGAVL